MRRKIFSVFSMKMHEKINFFLCPLYKNVQKTFCMSLKNFANCKKTTLLSSIENSKKVRLKKSE